MICIRVTSLFMFPLEQWLIIIAAAIAWFIVTFLILRGKKLDRITDAFDGWIRVILDRNFRKEAEKLSSEDVEDE